MGASVRPRANGAPSVMVEIPERWLRAIPLRLRGNAMDFQVGVIEFLPLAAGGNDTEALSVDADSYFLIVQACRTVTSVNDLTFLAAAPITVAMMDTGSSRNLSNAPVHIENLFGDAQMPCEWALPKLLSPASNLSCQVVNLDPGNAWNVRLAFHGIKIFGSIRQPE